MAPLAPGKPQFLNVDLHVESRQDLAALARALGPEDSWQSWDQGGVQFLHCSLALGRHSETPSSLILATIQRVRRVRGAARVAWKSAKMREFDIGIQANAGPARGEWTISVEAVRAAASVGAQIRITVYGSEPAVAPKPRSSRKP